MAGLPQGEERVTWDTVAASVRQPHRATVTCTAIALSLCSALALADPGTPAPAAPSIPSSSLRHHFYRRRHHVIRKKHAVVRPPATAPAAPAVAPAAPSAATEESAKPRGPALETRLDSFSRTVEIQPKNGNWKKAERKMPLVSDDKLRTGSASLARIQLGDGSKILLLQNSQAEMQSLTTVEKSIRLLRGHLRAIVSRLRGGNNFKVTTPVGVASVRGTDFEVGVDDDGKNMEVSVYEGQVGVSKLGELGKEVVLNAGDRIKFGIEQELSDPIRSGAVPIQRLEIRNEIQLAQAKDAVVAMAAEESRNADYEVGKSLIDVNGQRVRTEEYITRPAANEFKLVVLNERPTRFDYFTYTGTFNKDLPEDLSVALSQSRGQLGTQPDYYLTSYQTLASNTIDNITENATGGHLVKISFDGSQYTLTDPSDPTNTRVVDAAVLQSDGSYKIYNPIQDVFTIVSAANLSDALKISVLDSTTKAYRDLVANDVYFNTRFNDYTSAINGVLKTSFSKKSTVTNALAIDLDSDFANAPITTVTEQPDGADSLHNRLSLYYSDGSKTVYDTYIIDDNGKVGPSSAFDGLADSASFKNELEKWNYEQSVTSTEMGGRSIDLVVDPRIGTISGLIK